MVLPRTDKRTRFPARDDCRERHLARDVSHDAVGGGFWTTASAMGEPLIGRLLPKRASPSRWRMISFDALGLTVLTQFALSARMWSQSPKGSGMLECQLPYFNQ
jgi:hypothetical protein